MTPTHDVAMFSAQSVKINGAIFVSGLFLSWTPDSFSLASSSSPCDVAEMSRSSV